jgi:hypothetical protein
MDTWGQIGPEKGQYDADVLGLAAALTSGATVRVKLADRMTQYDLVLCRTHAMTRLGGIGPSEVDALYVSHMGKGAYEFPFGQGDTDPGYVNTKLGYTSDADGEVVSEFINRLFRAMTLAPVA